MGQFDQVISLLFSLTEKPSFFKSGCSRQSNRICLGNLQLISFVEKIAFPMVNLFFQFTSLCDMLSYFCIFALAFLIKKEPTENQC